MDDALTTAQPRVEVLPDGPALALRAAVVVAEHLRGSIARHGRALFGLAGGTTPRATYAELAGAELPWHAVDFVWGDERMVPADDTASNVRMARETLLAPLGIADGRIHAPRTDLDVDRAAEEYEAALRALDPRHYPPRLDLVLLGLGQDGHTASLFPGGPELDAPGSRLVIASVAPSAPHQRLTLTLPALGAARHVVFLVSGADKRNALERVLGGDDDLPASRVRPVNGSLLWLVDEDAAHGQARVRSR